MRIKPQLSLLNLLLAMGTFLTFQLTQGVPLGCNFDEPLEESGPAGGEIPPCGDGICNPEEGECDVFAYCKKDCDRSKCFGFPEGETCGDGLCNPLAGECADIDPCITDCPEPDFCKPGTCSFDFFSPGTCEPWEDDPADLVSYCVQDCACLANRVEDECDTTGECSGKPGTNCRPEKHPGDVHSFEEFVDKLLDIPCRCTICGNGTLDPGEDCDVSAPFEESGVESCDESGRSCDEFSCRCRFFREGDCANGIDDDEDSLLDCDDDEDCGTDLICTGGEFCDNCVDDDGDFLVDCSDPGCSGAEFCQPTGDPPVESCLGCLDDDGDGLADCADPDCAEMEFCAADVFRCECP